MRSKRIVLPILIASIAIGGFSQAPDKAKVIAGAERAFERVAKTNPMPAPGCAVGVSVNGESVFEKAFGLADMEHNIPNTPQTIFESGSVAKQFTAAALVLLQQDGKLNIDDPVRKYIPELPDYGKPLTIRHMLNHTAGLRDWGNVMRLTGVGRGDRIVTQDIALDVMRRQLSLDFEPGAEYSYSNSGYNLAAIIVERVSRKTFSDFLAERIFRPLGMTHSSIRDDYQRIVAGRAQAYSRDGAKAPWRLEMPLMNVYGNGGELTTVGDWLKWNASLDSKMLGAPFVEALETRGKLNDGRTIQYALGLVVQDHKGIKEVSHSGSTAGYQTFLARYPEKKLSIAVLCNGSSPGGVAIGGSIVDEIFGPFPEPQKSVDTASTGIEQLNKYVGLAANEKTHFPVRFNIENGKLRINSSPLSAQKDGSFLFGGNVRFKFKLDKTGKPLYADREQDGEIIRFVYKPEWKPAPAELSSFAGEWYSDEAQARVKIAIEGEKLTVSNKPLFNISMTPQYKDHFTADSYTIWFTRDKNGKIVRMHIGGSRMRDMPFGRVTK